MKRVIALTGVPACGKTTLSKHIGTELGLKVISFSEIVKESDLSDEYDQLRSCSVVELEKLEKALKPLLDACTIIDGLMSHLLDVTHTIVLRCSPTVLVERMKERGYNLEKIKENIESEYLGTILYESLERCDNVLEIDNTSGCDIEEIIEWLNIGGQKILEKDWTNEFQKTIT